MLLWRVLICPLLHDRRLNSPRDLFQIKDLRTRIEFQRIISGPLGA